MLNYIINSFILDTKKSLVDIYDYIKIRYNSDIIINDIKNELKNLIRKDIITFNANFYELTEKGNIILNDHKFYYSRIISDFYKKYRKNHKKYQLKEIREEQQYLRNYLINSKEHSCIICNKLLPLCLLEAAHLKPRNILNSSEKKDINIVELMCKYCHSLYDNGFLAVSNGVLHLSSSIEKYDLDYKVNQKINNYNLLNEKYFIFHYKFIFRK